MREKIEYSLVKLFLWLAKTTPKSFIYALMKGLTLLVYHLDKNRRTMTIKNLTMAFPEKTYEEIEALSKTPKKVVGDEGSVEERSLTEQIAFNNYRASASCGASKPPFGMRIGVVHPRGTV